MCRCILLLVRFVLDVEGAVCRWPGTVRQSLPVFVECVTVSRGCAADEVVGLPPTWCWGIQTGSVLSRGAGRLVWGRCWCGWGCSYWPTGL
ncbi:hypothetical protein BJX64DRAFT_267014 [Aspergillus heterothallicus]